MLTSNSKEFAVSTEVYAPYHSLLHELIDHLDLKFPFDFIIEPDRVVPLLEAGIGRNQ